MSDLLNAQLSRRALLKGGAILGSGALLGFNQVFGFSRVLGQAMADDDLATIINLAATPSVMNSA